MSAGQSSTGAGAEAWTPSDRLSVDKLTPSAYRAQLQVAKVLREVAQEVGLDRIVVELVNLRVSQINGCAYCLDVHTRAALDNGEDPRRLACLDAWRDSGLFSDRERAALALAELVTTLPDGYTQDREYAEARRHLDEGEMSALIWVAIAMNAFNRVSVLSRHPVRRRPDDPSTTPSRRSR